MADITVQKLEDGWYAAFDMDTYCGCKDEDCNLGVTGYGETEEEAIEDLQERTKETL